MLYRDVNLYGQAPTLAVLAGQKIISRVSYYEEINDFIKRFFPPVIDSGYFVRSHTFFIDSFIRHRITRPRRIFEQGTGWHGSEVLAFYLLGAERILTSDTSRWLRKATLNRTARLLLQQEDILRPIYERYLGRDIDIFDERMRNLVVANGDVSTLFDRGVIEYIVTKDPAFSPPAFTEYDLVFSNSVLQRMRIEDLKVFLVSKRNPGTTHFHRIDCADFQAMRNKHLHKLGYLLIDDEVWNRWTSKYLNYQNRLRSFEFLELFSACGYRPHMVDEYLAPENLAFLSERGQWFRSKYGARDPKGVAITNFTLIAEATHAS